MLIAVAATKGGVGKTTMAYELAACLGVLVDLEWDGGSATAMWGYDPGAYRRAPLLDAFERGPSAPPPRPRVKAHQPPLVPGHPDIGASTIPEDLVADCLTSWAERWDYRHVVVDTHPGANPLTDGAMAAADLIVVPVVLAARELDGLKRMLVDWDAYRSRILLVPNRIPPSPPKRWVEALTDLAGDIPVAPPISEHRWLTRRVRRAALCLQPNPGQAVARARVEYLELASIVEQAGK